MGENEFIVGIIEPDGITILKIKNLLINIAIIIANNTGTIHSLKNFFCVPLLLSFITLSITPLS